MRAAIIDLWPSRRMATILAAFTLLSANGASNAWAGDDFRGCLTRETETFYAKLATAILSTAIDPASVDDHFIGQAGDTIVKTCSAGTGQAEEADVAAFREHMTKWRVHLDQQLSRLTNMGGAD